MKKLLSLLSLLTISGAAMPMVVAAAPYQQTNNLEKLNNEKTQNSNLENNEKIKTIILEENNLENTNNYFLWEIVSALGEILLKNAEEIKSHIVEKIENLKNELQNNFIDFIKLNFFTKEIDISLEEVKNLENSEVKKIIFDYFKNELYLLTRKTNNLYKIKSNGFLQLIHSADLNVSPNERIDGFSLDSKINHNIYIFTTNKLYKHNIYDIKEEISNIGFLNFYLDNEGNIILRARPTPDNDIDFLNLIKHDEEDIPKNYDDVYKLRKIENMATNPNTVFQFDEYNNIYIKNGRDLYMIKKYDTVPTKISGKFTSDNYTGWNFYAIKDNIFIFSDKKFYNLKSGQTSVTEIPMADIYDHYLDSKQENFYITTEKGIYKFNILDQEKNKISNIFASKIAVDKSDNIFITNTTYPYRGLLVLLKKEDGSYKEYKILNDLQVGKYEKIFNFNKKIYLFTNTNNIFKVYYFDRLNEWINSEEKENNEIQKIAYKLEQERIDKERKDWIEEGGKEREKEWKINKLKEIEEYLKKRKEQGKLSSFEEKILSCLSKHISDGFALGFGVIGGAIAPGAGTISGATIGSAIGKWIGGILGDAIQEAVPGEKSCKF